MIEAGPDGLTGVISPSAPRVTSPSARLPVSAVVNLSESRDRAEPLRSHPPFRMPHREETPMSNAEQLSMPGENRAGGTTQIGTVSDFLREFGSPDEGGTHGGPEARHVAGLHLQRASQIHEAGQIRGNL